MNQRYQNIAEIYASNILNFLSIGRIGDGKKIHQVEYIPDEQLMIVLAGKQRQMRLIPVKALDQPTDTEWIKVADTKNCLTFATGVMRGSQGGKKIVGN